MSNPPSESFANWSEWTDPQNFPAALQRLLDTADWDQFAVERDLLPLRKALQAVAAAQGVGALHQAISAKLLPQHGHLMHRFGHLGPLVSWAVSPDRKWLATGSWVHDDYDEGGELMVWEIATGRCVNIAMGVTGGIGWPDYPNCIQWSPDGKWLGMAYDTNGVGNFHPFGFKAAAETEIYVTDGWSRPPAWCWGPDSQRMSIACWGQGSEVPGCIAPLTGGNAFEDDVRWFAEEVTPDIVPDDASDLQPFKYTRWSADGKLIYGHNSHGQAFGIEVETGELRYFSSFKEPIAWDVDDDLYAHHLAGLLFYETQTGLPTMKLPMILGAGEVHWSKVSGQQRLAVLVPTGNDFGADACVHVYAEGDLLCTVEAVPLHISYDELADRASWAWSPGGQQGAVLLTDRRVQVWAIEAEPELLVELQVHESATGISWGHENTLVVTSGTVVQFWELTSGKLRSSYDQEMADGLSFPSLDEAPLEGVDDMFPYDYELQPCAPIERNGDFEWIAAMGIGKVIAPASLHERLTEELSYTMGGKYAWPFEWAENEIRTSLAEANADWGLGFDIEADTPAGNSAPAFRDCSLDDVDKTWKREYKSIKKTAQVKHFQLPMRPKNAYKPGLILKGESLTEEAARELLGKCVLYANQRYGDSVEMGVLMSIDEGSAFIFFQGDNFFTSGNTKLKDFAYLAEAVPRS